MIAADNDSFQQCEEAEQLEEQRFINIMADALIRRLTSDEVLEVLRFTANHKASSELWRNSYTEAIGEFQQ